AEMRVVYQRHGGLSPPLMNRAPRYDVELSPQDASAARRLVPPDFFRMASTAQKDRRPDMFMHQNRGGDERRPHTATLAGGGNAPALRPFVEWLQHRAGVS